MALSSVLALDLGDRMRAEATLKDCAAKLEQVAAEFKTYYAPKVHN
jgi:hypothetical protein